MARHGAFWYPVRLLKKTTKDERPVWRLRWWRLCQFIDPDAPSSSESVLSESDIVDELWNEPERRRNIRVRFSKTITYSTIQLTTRKCQFGQWTHACQLPDNEDILVDPDSCPFTPEMDAALSPHRDVLASLVADPEMIPDVPVTRAINDGSLEESLPEEFRGKGMIPYTGGLDVTQLAQIVNWIVCHIHGARESFYHWMQRAAFAHAITIVIASQKHLKFSREYLKQKGSDTDQVSKEDFILNTAWKYQCKAELPDSEFVVDVDKECLAALEESLFTRSKAAGLAGCYQWGLDAGDHQNRWNPYADLPFHWAHDDIPEFDDELFKVSLSCHDNDVQ